MFHITYATTCTTTEAQALSAHVHTRCPVMAEPPLPSDQSLRVATPRKSWSHWLEWESFLMVIGSCHQHRVHWPVMTAYVLLCLWQSAKAGCPLLSKWQSSISRGFLRKKNFPCADLPHPMLVLVLSYWSAMWINSQVTFIQHVVIHLYLPLTNHLLFYGSSDLAPYFFRLLYQSLCIQNSVVI